MNVNRPRHRRRPSDKPPILLLLVLISVLALVCLGGVALAAVMIGG